MPNAFDRLSGPNAFDRLMQAQPGAMPEQEGPQFDPAEQAGIDLMADWGPMGGPPTLRELTRATQAAAPLEFQPEVAPREQWETLGKIRLLESVKRKLGGGRGIEKIPVTGAFSEAGRLLRIRSSAKAIEAHQVGTAPLSRSDLRYHANTVADWVEELEHLEARGQTIPAKVASGVIDLIPFAVEFLLTTGQAAGAKAGVKGVAKKLLKKYGKGAARRLAIKVAGKTVEVVAGAAARTPLMGGRVAAGGVRRELEGAGPAEAFLKSYVDVLIENVSETAGPTLAKGAKLIPGAGKIIGKMDNILKAVARKAGIGGGRYRALLESAGYHGILEEMGEERLGDAMRAVVGTEDFGLRGKKNTAFKRLVAAIPNGEQLLVEALTFAVPGTVGMLGRAPTAAAPTEAPGAEQAPTRPGARPRTLKDRIVQVWAKRAEREELIENRLDEIEEELVLPITKQFFAETYPRLNPQLKRFVEKHIQASSGVKPGDVIATEEGGVEVRADSWQEIVEAGVSEREDVLRYYKGEGKRATGVLVLMDLLNNAAKEGEAAAAQPVEPRAVEAIVGAQQTAPRDQAVTAATSERANIPPVVGDVFIESINTLVGEQDWQFEQSRVRMDKRHRAFKPEALKAITLDLQYRARPELLAKYEPRANRETKKLIARSQNLTAEERALSDQLRAEYDADWKALNDAGILDSFQEHYVNQIWQFEKGKKGRRGRRFGGRMPETLRRKLFEGYLEGIVGEGLEPLTLDAAKLRRIYEESKIRAISERLFLTSVRDMTQANGQKLLEPISKVSGDADYVLLDHPALRKYTFRGEQVNEETGERTVFFEKMPLAVHKSASRRMTAVLGGSKLRSIAGVREVLQINALGKNMLLSFSFFHHTALGKTAMFYGVNPDPFGPTAHLRGYRAGLDLIEAQDPIVEQGVKDGGLTLGTSSKIKYATEVASEGTQVLDWLIDQSVGRVGLVGPPLAWAPKQATKGIRNAKGLWDRQLWERYFVGLKALSYKMEFLRNVKRLPHLSSKEVAQVTARDINDNFGGLNFRRMGIPETYLDIFRLGLLAPDWTISNFRFFLGDAAKISDAVKYVRAVRAGEAKFSLQEIRRANRSKGASRYMLRAILTFQGLTCLANYMMWGDPFPQDEDDKDKWYMVKLPYRDENGRHYYLDLYGHFFEPIRATTDPFEWAPGKISFIGRQVAEQKTGKNWRGSWFGTVKDLTEGNLYRNAYGPRPPGWSTVPSRVIHAASGFLPIPVKMAGQTVVGERPAIELLGSAGFKIRRERKTKKKEPKY